MEPLGQYLRDVRESKNLSIEKITEETHIVKKFIIAIENDDYTVFPGDAYLRGFLRNYSEFLELDTEDVINRFDRIQLSETPTPIEKLIPKPRPNYPLIAFIAIILVIVPLVGLLGYFGVKLSASYIEKLRLAKELEEAEKSKGKIFSFETDEAVFDLKNGQQVKININNKDFFLQIKKLDPTVLIANVNEGSEKYLIRSHPEKIDLNGDGDADVEIILNQWDVGVNAIIKLTRLTSETEKILSSYNEYLTGEVETIYRSPQKISLDFMITILHDTLIRYKIDNEEETEKLFNKDSVVTIKAKSQVLLWLSNAGAVSLNFDQIDKQLVPGAEGAIDVKLFHVKKSEGQFLLQMNSLN